jgi:hypothetical protein
MWLNEGCIVTSAFIVCREGKIGKQKKGRNKRKEWFTSWRSVYQEWGTRIKYMENASPQTQTERHRQSEKTPKEAMKQCSDLKQRAVKKE